MRAKFFFQAIVLLCLSVNVRSQSCIPTNLNHSVVNLSCNQVCTDLTFQIPHVKGTDDYAVTSIPFAPYAYSGGAEVVEIYNDDQFSHLINLPFTACFYGATFNSFVIGSNGIVTFDATQADCRKAWSLQSTGLPQPIPFVGTGGCTATGTKYPRYSIMSPYHDIDPNVTLTSPNRRIEWRIEGAAPCRKLVVSFYKIPLFGDNSQLNTSQIVFHESTGIVDIYIEQKTLDITGGVWNGNLAILGLQKDASTAFAVPGKNCTVWSEDNTAYRFIPSGPGSRFVSSELLDMTATVVANADTATTVAGLLDVKFPNFCPPVGSNQFVVKTIFSACENAATQLTSLDTITINRTNSLNATATATNTACGPPTGTITVTVPAGVGTPPYTFTLDGGAPQTGASPYTFTNVAQGTHNIVVTDASPGCTSNLSVTVNANTILTANATFTGTSCTGASNGTITITSVNGTGPYTFVLDGGAAVPGTIPYTFSNLSAGTHNVVVNDLSNGCVTGVMSFTIPAGPAFVTTASGTDALCNGAASGTITVTQPGSGNAPFEYSLDNVNWQTSNTFNGLAAGTYTVYYREAGGCNGSTTVTIGEPPALALNTNEIDVICHGESNGTILITPTGGTAPYQYSIDGVNWQSSNIFNVPAGNYTPAIRDANGCITSTNITVNEPAALTATTINDNASCNGGNDGVITVLGTGGNGGYQYSIDGVNFQTSNIFNVAPGTYTITIKDSKNCTQTTTATVGLTNDLTFIPQTDPTICEGKSVQLDLVSNGLQYNWSPATGLSSTTIANPVANPTTTTQYVVTTTLGRCSATDIVVVNVNAAPVPDAGVNGFICYGQTYTLQASGGTQYAWSPPDYLSNPHIANPVSSAPHDMTYTLTIVSDMNGCGSLFTDEMTLDVTPPIKINTYPFDTVVYNGAQLHLLAVPTDPDVINFSWTPVSGLDNGSIAGPTVTAGAIGDDIVYQVTGSTIAGCKGEGYVHVKVYKGPDIYVPTGFTPNGDGRNDRFVPFPVGIKSLNYLRVYNRWGQLVFATTRLHDGWDGTIKGVAQPTGTFVWMIQAVTDQGKVITKKGTVTLIR